METMKLVRSLLATFSIGMSLGEITVPLVADAPQKLQLPPPIPVTQVAEVPRLKPTPLLVPDCFIRCRIRSVHDCDTIRADILLPWGIVMENESIRAGDFDAWEVDRTRERSNKKIKITESEIAKGKAATEQFRKLLDTGTLYLQPLPNEDRESRGRILATWLLVTRENQCIFIRDWMHTNRYIRPDVGADE